MTRPAWPLYWTQMAFTVSQRSTCPRAHHGAVIVIGHELWATGYNGSAPGEPHCEDEGVGCDLLDCSEHGDHCIRVTHAERNALIQFQGKVRDVVNGTTLYFQEGAVDREASRVAGYLLARAEVYVTGMPCHDCYRALRKAGVRAEAIHWYGKEESP